LEADPCGLIVPVLLQGEQLRVGRGEATLEAVGLPMRLLLLLLLVVRLEAAVLLEIDVVQAGGLAMILG
jgi:hypothetical protein